MAKNARTGYVIIFAFLQQQRLQERASLLSNTRRSESLCTPDDYNKIIKCTETF